MTKEIFRGLTAETIKRKDGYYDIWMYTTEKPEIKIKINEIGPTSIKEEEAIEAIEQEDIEFYYRLKYLWDIRMMKG